MPRTTLAERQERLAQHRARLQTEEGRVREAERKARTRRLIETGGLIEKAELGALDAPTLYGALLSLREGAGDADTVKRWAALGSRAFTREASAREAEREPLIITFAVPPPAPIPTRLRALGFRWSKVLHHWEGHAPLAAAEAIASEHDGMLKRVDVANTDDTSA